MLKDNGIIMAYANRKLGFTYVSTQTIFYGVVGNKEFKMFEYTNIK